MLRVFLPFFKRDARQMAEVLRWAMELNPEGVQHNCIVYNESGTDSSEVLELAKNYFKANVLHFTYEPPPIPNWPAAPNWVWQAAARLMDDKKVNEPWFFWECDAIPLRPGWLDAIYNAYLKGGKRFAGHIVHGMGHMNGVGIYPPDVRRRCQDAMMCRSAAWDYVLKDTITGDCTDLNHLIQHVWNIKEEDGTHTNGDGKPVTFPDWPAVERYMDFNCSLLHRTKDGTLIQRLREKREAERKRIEEEQRITMAVETNVPQFTAVPEAVIPERKVQDVGPVQIMMVTYHKDLPWFDLSMKCLRKHVTRFSGITVCVPERDKKLFRPYVIQYGIHLASYDEVDGKGMLQHMGIMAMADEFVPKQVKFVAHIDADTMYKMATEPSDYFEDGKPVYMIRTYESLVDDRGVISDCAQWKPIVEEQIALPATHFTMCAFPFIFPIEFYSKYRKRIEYVHKKPMMEYLLEGRNSFPQSRVDFQAMGMFAYATMRERFHWIDIGVNHPRKDRHKSYWSHAGVRPETQSEIEGFLK